jgi:hypothetical protein
MPLKRENIGLNIPHREKTGTSHPRTGSAGLARGGISAAC